MGIKDGNSVLLSTGESAWVDDAGVLLASIGGKMGMAVEDVGGVVVEELGEDIVVVSVSEANRLVVRQRDVANGMVDVEADIFSVLGKRTKVVVGVAENDVRFKLGAGLRVCDGESIKDGDIADVTKVDHEVGVVGKQELGGGSGDGGIAVGIREEGDFGQGTAPYDAGNWELLNMLIGWCVR